MKITWTKDDVMNDPVYFAIFEASTHTHTHTQWNRPRGSCC
jgi:hypothetical protein